PTKSGLDNATQSIDRDRIAAQLSLRVELQVRPLVADELNQHLAQTQLDKNLQRQQTAERVIETLDFRGEMTRDQNQRNRSGNDRPCLSKNAEKNGAVQLRMVTKAFDPGP